MYYENSPVRLLGWAKQGCSLLLQLTFSYAIELRARQLQTDELNGSCNFLAGLLLFVDWLLNHNHIRTAVTIS